MPTPIYTVILRNTITDVACKQQSVNTVQHPSTPDEVSDLSKPLTNDFPPPVEFGLSVSLGQHKTAIARVDDCEQFNIIQD